MYFGSDRARIQPQVFGLQSFALGPYPVDFNNIDEILWTILKGGYRDDRKVISNSNTAKTIQDTVKEKGQRGPLREDQGR